MLLVIPIKISKLNPTCTTSFGKEYTTATFTPRPHSIFYKYSHMYANSSSSIGINSGSSFPIQPFQNVKVKVLNDRAKVMRFELSV